MSKRILCVLVVIITIGFLAWIVYRRINRADVRDTDVAVQNATITVDVTQENYNTTNLGANFSALGLGDFLRTKSQGEYDDLVEAFNLLGYDHFRIPAGCENTLYDFRNPANSIDYNGNKFSAASVNDFIDFATRTDTDIMYAMPVFGLMPIESSDKSASLLGHKYKSACSREVVTKWNEEDIRYFVREFTIKPKNEGKRYVKYYELGNEEYLMKNTTLGKYVRVKDYLDAAKIASNIIKDELKNSPELASSVKIYATSGHGYYDSSGNWVDQIFGVNQLANYPGVFDNITIHPYYITSKYTSENDSLYSVDFHLEEKFLKRYKSVLSGKYSTPAMTEWNAITWGADKFANENKYEHYLYLLSHYSVQVDNQIPISTLHQFLWYDSKTLSNDNTTDFFPNNSFEPTAQGLMLKTIEDYLYDTHIKTTIKSPQITRDSKKYDKIVANASVNTNKDEIGMFVLNRGKSTIDTQIDLGNFCAEGCTYETTSLKAPKLSSPLKDFTLTTSSSTNVNSSRINLSLTGYGVVFLNVKKGGVITSDDPTKCAIFDINDDLKVNIIDFIIFKRLYNVDCDDSTAIKMCKSMDTNGNDKLDVVDFVAFRKEYNKVCD